jgi:hypothetical protein
MGNFQIQCKRGDTYRGSQYTFSLSSVELSAYIPVDLTDASILMQVKHKATDDENVLEFSTSTATISISAPALSGIFYTEPRIIEVDANKYVYDIQITLNTGRILTPVSDNFLVTQDVSR